MLLTIGLGHRIAALQRLGDCVGAVRDAKGGHDEGGEAERAESNTHEGGKEGCPHPDVRQGEDDEEARQDEED